MIIDKNKKRVPVVCGIGGNDTLAVIKQVEQYPLDDIDGILSVSPYYNKPSQEGIIRHFKMIAEQSPLPIIVYNVPGRTGSNMLASTTLHLANECEKIVAVKEASGNLVQGMEIIQHKPAHFTVLSGDDNLAMAQIACGYDGVISVAANCFPSMFCSMISASMNHQFKLAQQFHYQLLDGIDLLFCEGNPAGVKAVLHELGICENELRLPMMPVTEATQHAIRQFLKTL